MPCYRSCSAHILLSVASRAIVLDDLGSRRPTRADVRTAALAARRHRIQQPALAKLSSLPPPAARCHFARLIEPADSKPASADRETRASATAIDQAIQLARSAGGSRSAPSEVNLRSPRANPRLPRTGAHHANRATARRPCRYRSRSPGLGKHRGGLARSVGPGTHASRSATSALLSRSAGWGEIQSPRHLDDVNGRGNSYHHENPLASSTGSVDDHISCGAASSFSSVRQFLRSTRRLRRAMATVMLARISPMHAGLWQRGVVARPRTRATLIQCTAPREPPPIFTRDARMACASTAALPPARTITARISAVCATPEAGCRESTCQMR